MSLTILNLSHSKHLTNTPDFSNLPNLKWLVLKDCPSLSNVHQSIGDLTNILMINLKDCTSLSKLPKKIYRLKSLKTLIFSGCVNIDKLEEDVGQMESLTTLIANNTAVKQVPFSILRSKSIGYLSLCGYEGLSHHVFPSLIWSWMSPTMNSYPFNCSFRDRLSSLVCLDVQNNNLGDLSPMLCGLSNIRRVWVQCSSKSAIAQDVRRILDVLYDVSFTKLETTSHALQMPELTLRSLLIGMGSYHHVIKTLSKSISEVRFLSLLCLLISLLSKMQKFPMNPQIFI